MLKWRENIKKHMCFEFSLFFSIFGFFENISKTWVKNWVATITKAKAQILKGGKHDLYKSLTYFSDIHSVQLCDNIRL